MKIIESEDCGNSPKNKMVQKIAIAIIKKDTDKIKNLCTKDIVWDISGVDQFQGHESLKNAISTLSKRKIAEVEIDTAISHGRKGASFAIGKQEGNAVIVQANIIEFKSAKGSIIAKITTIETVY